jgi:hypothetical protein
MSDQNRIDRRQFTGALVIASTSAVAVLAPSLGHADDPSGEKKPIEVTPPAPPPEELLLLNYLMQRYPSEHYDDVAIQGIYRDLRGDTARGRILSNFSLKNSDEPFVFRVYRAQE